MVITELAALCAEYSDPEVAECYSLSVPHSLHGPFALARRLLKASTLRSRSITRTFRRPASMKIGCGRGQLGHAELSPLQFAVR